MQQLRDVVLSPLGRPIQGATVTVTLAAGGAAALYSDNGTTALGSNVLTSDSSGEYVFYAASGRYTLTIAASGYTTTTRDVILLDPTDDRRSVVEFGASPSASAATNKAALQDAIDAVQASGRPGFIVIPADVGYGYLVADRTTWPISLCSGVTVPITFADFSLGADYGTYPTTYEGTQERRSYHTPQTTPTLGSHDGNTVWHRAAWAPNICISNDQDLTGSRLASDNRRARFTLFNCGIATWSIGQGAQSGSNLTDEDLSNLLIEKYASHGPLLLASTVAVSATSATLAQAWTPASGTWSVTFSGGDTKTVTFTNGSTAISWTGGLAAAATTTARINSPSAYQLIWEARTGNFAIGGGTNSPAFSYHLKSITAGYQTLCIESLAATADLVVRNSNGSTDDVYLRNASGVASIRIASQGDALTIAKATRRLRVEQSMELKRLTVTYSASMALDLATAVVFTVAVSDASAHAFAAVTNIGDASLFTLAISNTTGGAIATATFDASWRQSGYAAPATGKHKTCLFFTDGAVVQQIGQWSPDLTN